MLRDSKSNLAKLIKRLRKDIALRVIHLQHLSELADSLAGPRPRQIGIGGTIQGVPIRVFESAEQVAARIRRERGVPEPDADPFYRRPRMSSARRHHVAHHAADV